MLAQAENKKKKKQKKNSLQRQVRSLDIFGMSGLVCKARDIHVEKYVENTK